MSFLGEQAESAKIKIMTSIFPLKEFAAAVAGERGETELLLPPGSGVHTWQPRAGDILRLAACDVFIYVGADLEPWIEDMMRGLATGPKRIVEASEGLELQETSTAEKHEGHAGHGISDPHIWLDFGIDGQIIDRIAETLASLDPEGAPVYRANADATKERLRMLDDRFRKQLNTCRQKTVILAGHAAFGYLARRYGLNQVSLYGMSPDAQPTPRQLMEIVGFAKRNGVNVIFFERAASPDLARTLARELGARILVLNPGHNLTSEEINKGLTFFDIMEENLRTLSDGLGCL